MTEGISVPSAPKKEGGAPILTLDQAICKVVESEFNIEAVEVEGKEGHKFFRDPGLNAQLEIADDIDDGTYDGIRFWQNFKLKWNAEDGCWEVRDGTALGAIVNANHKTRTGEPWDFSEPFVYREDEWDGSRSVQVPKTGIYVLQVEANGPWTIRLKPEPSPPRGTHPLTKGFSSNHRP